MHLDMLESISTYTADGENEDDDDDDMEIEDVIDLLVGRSSKHLLLFVSTQNIPFFFRHPQNRSVKRKSDLLLFSISNLFFFAESFLFKSLQFSLYTTPG